MNVTDVLARLWLRIPDTESEGGPVGMEMEDVGLCC